MSILISKLSNMILSRNKNTIFCRIGMSTIKDFCIKERNKFISDFIGIVIMNK